MRGRRSRAWAHGRLAARRDRDALDAGYGRCPPLAGFFANLTKRFFRTHEEVELSALENAIAVAVDTGPPQQLRPALVERSLTRVERSLRSRDA